MFTQNRLAEASSLNETITIIARKIPDNSAESMRWKARISASLQSCRSSHFRLLHPIHFRPSVALLPFASMCGAVYGFHSAHASQSDLYPAKCSAFY